MYRQQEHQNSWRSYLIEARDYDTKHAFSLISPARNIESVSVVLDNRQGSIVVSADSIRG